MYIFKIYFFVGGLQFFLSSNNVILSSGDENGVIAPIFFQKVVDRKTGLHVIYKMVSIDCHLQL